MVEPPKIAQVYVAQKYYNTCNYKKAHLPFWSVEKDSLECAHDKKGQKVEIETQVITIMLSCV